MSQMSTHTQMCINGGVARSSRQVLILSVRDVLSSPVVSIFLCESEVYEKQFIAMSADSHQKVVGFYIAMNEILVVDELNATDHLIR